MKPALELSLQFGINTDSKILNLEPEMSASFTPTDPNRSAIWRGFDGAVGRPRSSSGCHSSGWLGRSTLSTHQS